MRRIITAVLALALLAPTVAFGQWSTITTNNINPATSSAPIKIGPSGSELTIDSTTGQLSQVTGSAPTDGFVFVPAYRGCTSTNTNFLISRVAANNWALSRTATTGGEEIVVVCALDNALQRAGGTKGIKITSIALVHDISTASLLFATWGKLATLAFVNATNTDVSGDKATTPTLPTTFTTTPYVTAVTVTTPFYWPGNTNQAINAEWSVYPASTSRYRLYGVGVTFTRLDH